MQNRALRLLTSLTLAVAAASSAHALTVTFDAGSGIATNYTENGLKVAPDVSGFYVILGDNGGNASPDLENHPGCCSTPYRFTYNAGALFSVAQWDFVLNGGTHTFTSSTGASITPGATGVVTPPVAGFTGITYFLWHAPGSDQTQTAIMDNLKFCPGDCSDANVCTTDACDPDASGADVNGCTHTANAASCDDGVFCNGADTCAGGGCNGHAGDPCATGGECNDTCNENTHTCASSVTTACTDDGNVCTDDHCNGSGTCIHPNNSGPCDDGTFCNGTDTCSAGMCVVHAGNPCTGGPECANSCNEGAQNCFKPAITSCSDDGNRCTDDHCDGAGACIHPSNAASCNDGNACTQDSCAPATGCVNDPAPLEGTSCDDGNSCTETDVCTNGRCAGTVAQSCDDNNPCTLDGCDLQGGCTHDATARNGFACDDQNSCTTQDTCTDGVCRGTLTEADSDGDGYCDRVELIAGCNPNDAAEIPPQPASFAGAPGKGPGEVFLTYATPARNKPSLTTDPSCVTAGTCGPIGFCSAGRIGDPCQTDADCAQAANTCRLVVNYGNVPDLTLLYAKMNGVPLTSFTPATRSCSRKVDVSIDALRRVNRLRLKAQGTVAGARRRDRDNFKFLP